MTPNDSPIRDLHFLAELAQRYHRIGGDETGGHFLRELRELGRERLEGYRAWADDYLIRKVDGAPTIRPVVFARRIVVDRLLRGEDLTPDDLQEILDRIEARDTEYFSGYTPYLEALANLRIGLRGPFVIWNPFRILFYIDYYPRADRVTAALGRVADELESRLALEDIDRRLAGFNHNQNFGTDRCWLALYPSSRPNHKEAVQLFLSILPAQIEVGLGGGSRTDAETTISLTQRHDSLDFDAIVEELGRLRPSFVEANRALKEGKADKEIPVAASPARPKHGLNQILYGPPGTGKTHHVRERAVEIVDGSTEGRTSGEINARFSHLLENGQVEFLTFHPSFSYEEFVEGLRYDLEERIPVIHDGILKRLAKRAINPFQRRMAREGARIWKVSLGDASENHVFDRCMRDDHIAVGWLAEHDLTGLSPEEISDTVQAQGVSARAGRIKSINYLVHDIQDGDFVAVLESERSIRAIGVVEGPYEYLGPDTDYPHTRPVRWLDRQVHDIYELNDSTRLTLNTIYPLDRVQLDDFLELLPDSPRPSRPHVLIIDEINRGDPARIFGEMITLLEEDKRRGAANELTVRLPYSQENFRLPANLFILGTMNSTDRSIALMDAALRRRFEFEELRPNVEVLRDSLFPDDPDHSESELTPEDVDLICAVFEILNTRIAILLDVDHQIGHSYFMGIQDLSELRRVLYRQVLPLLQEYFHNDRDRLTRLLGRYDARQKAGFVALAASDRDAGLSEDAMVESELPWTFHRYHTSELQEALRATFLPSHST